MTTLKLKNFPCPLHPKENILRVSNDPYTNKTLYCVECVMFERSQVREKLIQLDDLIELIHLEYQTFYTMKREIKPPQYVMDFLDDEQYYLKKYQEQIKDQKNKIHQKVLEMEDLFINVFKKFKSTIYDQLDLQCEKMTKKFSDLRERVNKSYFPNDPKKSIDVNGIYDDLNSCSNSMELQEKLTHYFKDIDEFQKLRINSDVEKIVKQRIDTELDKVRDDLIDVPQSTLLERDDAWPVLLNLAHKAECLLQSFTGLEVRQKFNTQNMVHFNPHQDHFKQFLNKDYPFNLKLMFKASINGFDVSQIAAAFDLNINSLVLITTNESGEMLGCYKEKIDPFRGVPKEYFSFSFDSRVKVEEDYEFPKLESDQYSVVGCFFSGSVYVVNKSNKQNGSYQLISNYAQNKEGGGGGGGDQTQNLKYRTNSTFTAREIEIYSLEYIIG